MVLINITKLDKQTINKTVRGGGADGCSYAVFTGMCVRNQRKWVLFESEVNEMNRTILFQNGY